MGWIAIWLIASLTNAVLPPDSRMTKISLPCIVGVSQSGEIAAIDCFERYFSMSNRISVEDIKIFNTSPSIHTPLTTNQFFHTIDRKLRYGSGKFHSRADGRFPHSVRLLLREDKGFNVFFARGKDHMYPRLASGGRCGACVFPVHLNIKSLDIAAPDYLCDQNVGASHPGPRLNLGADLGKPVGFVGGVDLIPPSFGSTLSPVGGPTSIKYGDNKQGNFEAGTYDLQPSPIRSILRRFRHADLLTKIGLIAGLWIGAVGPVGVGVGLGFGLIGPDTQAWRRFGWYLFSLGTALCTLPYLFLALLS